MNTDRDKFLTEAMGECWHEWVIIPEQPRKYSKHQHCIKCDKRQTLLWDCIETLRTDFSTWPGFGKLLEWAQEQDEKFWVGFALQTRIVVNGCISFDLSLINPDRFANSVYEFMKSIDSNELKENHNG
jgi:hypothetical protein